MARPRKTTDANPEPSNDLDSIVSDFLNDLNKKANGNNKAMLAGDLQQSLYGLPIPYLAFQYALGGVDVMPTQRYYTVSGMHKSFKSTLMKEIGAWHMAAGGIYFDIDNEGKTSPTMFSAMTAWRAEQLARGRHVFKETQSVEEWQDQITEAVKFSQRVGPREPGKRIPIFIALDSLTGKGTESAQEDLMKEGHAASRGYPMAAAATANFIKSLRLTGTTISLGVVRHLTQDINAAPSYNGPRMKEAGAVAVNFQYVAALRMARLSTIRAASHPSAPVQNIPVEGYSVAIHCEQSCLGPIIDRKLEVDILWQYVRQEDGSMRQLMWYDWDGALGYMLWQRKYDANKDKRDYEVNLEHLDSILPFTQPKPNRINCEKLGLEMASFTEFGRAIRMNPEVTKALQNFLCIAHYPDIQTADIEAATE